MVTLGRRKVNADSGSTPGTAANRSAQKEHPTARRGNRAAPATRFGVDPATPLRHLPVCQRLGLLRIGLGAGLPDHLLDLVFTLGAEVFSKAAPVKTRETSPEVASQPVFGWLNFSSADDAGVHFSSRGVRK